MVTMGVFPFQGKTQMVEPGIEPGTSWLVVRNSDHQATRLVSLRKHMFKQIKCECKYAVVVGTESINRLMSIVDTVICM